MQQVRNVFYILKNCVANPNNIIIINFILQSQGVLGRHSIRSLLQALQNSSNVIYIYIYENCHFSLRSKWWCLGYKLPPFKDNRVSTPIKNLTTICLIEARLCMIVMSLYRISCKFIDQWRLVCFSFGKHLDPSKYELAIFKTTVN